MLRLPAREQPLRSLIMRGEADRRVALVTGAGSPTGIGFATARILGREGTALAIASTTDRIHERSAELTEAGFEAGGFVADLTDREQTRRMVDGILELFGRIDILVNNAGMVTVDTGGWEDREFLDMDDAAWDRDLEMNLGTAYNVTKAALPGMVERGWGRIVMVSSVTGPVATAIGSSGYAAAKAGMDGLMRGLAIEVARHGVTVNSVLPGWIATGSQTPEEEMAGRYTPVGRSGTPEEVGELIAFLASDRASYLTGQPFVVDGGNTIQEPKGP
jgi:3-oxoacyl-[acyl-carrier protein] reductase